MAKLTRDELIKRVAKAIHVLRHSTREGQARAAIETYEELTLAGPYGAEARNRLLRGLHGSTMSFDPPSFGEPE